MVWGVVSGWLKCFTLIVYFISIIIASVPFTPSGIRSWRLKTPGLEQPRVFFLPFFLFLPHHASCVHACLYAQSLQSFSTLFDPIDHSPPGSSVHGIFQARILEWVVMSSSRGSSQPRDWTGVCLSSALQADSFTVEPQGRPPCTMKKLSSLPRDWPGIYHILQWKRCLNHWTLREDHSVSCLWLPRFPHYCSTQVKKVRWFSESHSSPRFLYTFSA